MGESAALRTAIDLLHLPSEVHRLRDEPLPRGVPLLLRVAAGEDKARTKAIEITERPGHVVREAAGFFIEQILFAPGTDSYRVLGTSSDATAREIRGNMALLIRWLHPDLDQGEERSVFVGRVTAAWDNLKTKERRLAYDRTLPSKTKKHSPDQKVKTYQRSPVGVKVPRKQGSKLPHAQNSKTGTHGLETYHFKHPGPLRRLLIALLGGMRQ